MAASEIADIAFERAWHVYRLINPDKHEHEERRVALERASSASAASSDMRTRKQSWYWPSFISSNLMNRRCRAKSADPAKSGKKWNKRSELRLTKASRHLEEDTLKKILLIGALAFAASTIAQTASAAEFYVVHDTATKKCTVVDTKPTTTTTTIVDNGTFKTKTEAETGMKTMKVCTSH